jgi:hypothetical protein
MGVDPSVTSMGCASILNNFKFYLAAVNFDSLAFAAFPLLVEAR